MANARALDKRRKSIRNIRKITRTMELIATARFKKAMDRASAATAYTARISQLVKDLSQSGLEVSHPLLEPRENPSHAALLVLTANRGLCGGYNGNVIRRGLSRHGELSDSMEQLTFEVSGKRGISAMKFRKLATDAEFTQFDDQPSFEEVEVLANRYLDAYAAGTLDRLDVAYTRFISSSRQEATVETLLPLGALETDEAADTDSRGESMYEFLPSAGSILEEVVPSSFKVKLFKCFLDAAVSEQIARMVAMKSATENADDMIKNLSMTYNRARQSQITGEIMEIIGGVEALKN
ncbi:MAG: ATP synthase F1 subunit gamma [Planctomycetaceae bacterium]|nr:ATP synthase F1 subunit gamma [Planctomycetaceae bacterium]